MEKFSVRMKPKNSRQASWLLLLLLSFSFPFFSFLLGWLIQSISSRKMGLVQTPSRGKLVLDWELPMRLRGQDISMYVKENAVFTLRHGSVLAGKCKDQIVQLFGDVGSRALDAVVSALEGGVSGVSHSRAFLFVTPLILGIQRTRI